MARKKYVSSNTKYKKHSQVVGATGHVNRVFAENKNSFPEHTPENFGDNNLHQRYLEAHRAREAKTGKKTRKDATTYCETVLAFSLEQYEYIERAALQKANGDKKQAKRLIEQKFTECTREFEQAIKDRFGLTPLGFNMHLDEGHIDPKTGELKRNIHSHVGWYNYDFEKGVSPWRKMGKKQLSEMQNIADRCFKKLGYERGLKASETNKKHLERDDFIAQKQVEVANQVEREQEKTKQLAEQNKQTALKNAELAKQAKAEQERAKQLAEQNKQTEEKIRAIEKRKESLIESYKEKAEKPAKLFQRFLFYGYDYLKALFTEKETEEKKKRYEKSRDDLDEQNLSSEQSLMVKEIKADIEYHETPKARLENRLRRKY